MGGVTRTWVNRLSLAVLAVMAAGFAALGVAEAWADAPTFDEPVYVSAGLAAVLHHDVTLNDEHPPLPKVLAVLPVLVTHPVVPANGGWSGDDEESYGARFIAAQLAAGKLRDVTFASRLVPLAETVGVAFVLFAVASELSGPVAGVLAGMLWLASPLVLGVGHLDGTDVPFALGASLSSWALVRWLRVRDTRTLMWLAFALAVAAETQVTGLLVVASGLAVVIGAEWRSGVMRALKQAGLAGLIVWASVWAVYLVLDPAMLSQVPLLVPRPYLDGIGYLAVHDTTGSSAYIAGIAYTGGRWWYWPLSLVIKWPGAALLLLVAGVVGMPAAAIGPAPAGRPRRRPARRADHRLHTDHAQGCRRALPAASPRPVGGGRGQRAGRGARRRDRCTAQTPGRNRRGRHARCGGRQHRRILPGLDRLDRLAVPAGLHDGDRFQHRLGPGSLRPAVVEREQGSVGGLLRAPRYHHRGHSRRPAAARHRADSR